MSVQPITTQTRRVTAEETEAMGDGTGGKGLKVALAFGVVAATIELGIVLWMMYC